MNLSSGLNLSRGSNIWLVSLKVVLNFQDLSRRSFETVFWGFETRHKFIKFGHCLDNCTAIVASQVFTLGTSMRKENLKN